MNKASRLSFFENLSNYFKDPQTELNFVNTYTLLVAVVLSAQSTDKGVNKATKELFRIATTPQAMIALGEERLVDHIRTIGLYKNKAKNVLALSHKLLNEFNGNVPKDRKALMTLPGVGRKTANVVLNVAFGEPTMPVDTHVFRLGNRTGLAKGKNVRDVEDKLLKAVPKPYAHDAHHLLILLGRYICTARKPKCQQCPVLSQCEYKNKT